MRRQLHRFCSFYVWLDELRGHQPHIVAQAAQLGSIMVGALHDLSPGGYHPGMAFMPAQLPDNPAVLKQLLAYMQSKVAMLKEENVLLRQRLFGRKTEQSADSTTPQLALFDETANIAVPAIDDTEEDVVGPRNAVASASPCLRTAAHRSYPRKLTCACGCREHVIGEETSEQMDICADADPDDQTYPQG